MLSAADSFAADIQKVMAWDPFWMGVSRGEPQVSSYTNPGKMVSVTSAPKAGWGSAIKNALQEAARSANPFKPVSGSSAAISKATTEVSESGKRFLDAGSTAVLAAGEGITSGFRWAVGLLMLGAAFYVFTMLSPFIPRPVR